MFILNSDFVQGLFYYALDFYQIKSLAGELILLTILLADFLH